VRVGCHGVSCDKAAAEKKPSGAAKTSFTTKCVKDAIGVHDSVRQPYAYAEGHAAALVSLAKSNAFSHAASTFRSFFSPGVRSVEKGTNIVVLYQDFAGCGHTANQARFSSMPATMSKRLCLGSVMQGIFNKKLQ
jgi:hypothetical protein